jgi:hypothetical protein
MILSSYIPWFWFSLMNEYVEKYQKKEIIPESLLKTMQIKIRVLIFGVGVLTTSMMIFL